VKIGDLIRLLDDPEVLRNNQDIPPQSVGLITEWTVHTQGGPLASCWVQWNGRRDWDSMFVEDLEKL